MYSMKDVMLPEFESPPVIEVVFGVQFKELKNLTAPYTGTYWEFLGKENYPKSELRAGLNHIIESYDGSPITQQSISIGNVPPLPRVLYVNKELNSVIQLQGDRFLQNWRKIEDADTYPRYNELFPEFQKQLKDFAGFLEKQEIGKLEIDQYELTYINHVPINVFGNGLNAIEEIFPDFKCKSQEAFLPEPEVIEWRRIFRFPDNKGRLRVSAKQATKSTGEEIIVFDLTARGFAENFEEWFNMAHSWIVNGFDDLTSEKIKTKIWRKK